MTARVAVVTGAASGIGRAVARHLLGDGFAVALLDRDGDGARAAAGELAPADGPRALGVGVDVADRPAVRAAIAAVRDELGPVTAIVTSAGIETTADVLDVSDDDWDRTLAVNLTGTWTCVQAVVPDMLAAGWGRIVTISSAGAQTGAPRMAAYVASKAGVMGLTRALSVDLAPHGITVNTIPPSIIDTPMSRRAFGDERIAAMARRTPVRRAGTPDDVAATVSHLCSDAAGFITGQAIGVNGGWYL
jgi:2-hydroxycyclohexanecarboxyl-CoA dehydrogenase